MENAADSQGVTRFPPGSAAPRGVDRLRDPDHLDRLNAGKKAWLALPKEERQRISAERKAAKMAKLAAREARNAAKHGRAPLDDDAPPTVRSSRGATTSAPPPDVIPRGRVALSGELRGLIDLCEALPHLGDGTCFIQVTRLKPAVAFSVATAGVQKPIWTVIDDAEFSVLYGGAEYSLRGYSLKDDGKARALTDPVAYKVSGPPNLDSALTEEDAMRPNPQQQPQNGHVRRPGLVTPHAATAEAQMYDRRLTHEERMDEKNSGRAEERRRRHEEREAEREDRQMDVARLMAEDKEKEMGRLREMQEQQLNLVREQNNKGTGVEDFAKLLSVLKPGEETQALSRQHAAEIRQISESHKEEMLRLSEQNRTELQRLSESHAAALRRVEDQARSDRERSDALVRETDRRTAEQLKENERRASDQVKEAERRADGRVTDFQSQAKSQYEDVKNRGEERLRDQTQQAQQRLEDLKEAHAREMRSKDSEIALMRTNLEGNMTVILSGKDTEIKRLQHDLRDARDLAEKNKDWVGKMKEAGETAEALGYVKPEAGDGGGGEEDLKTTAIKAGLGMLNKLPEMISAAGDTISKIRNPGVPPELARAQARSGAVRSSMRTMPRTMAHAQPLVLQPLTFATEGGADYSPPGEAAPPRANPLPPPFQEAPPLPALEQSSTHSVLPMPQPQQSAPPQQQYPTAPPPQAMAPAPQAQQAPVAASEPPPAPAASAGDANTGMIEGIVSQFAPLLAQNFESKIPPEDVAKAIVAENGVELARTVLSAVTIDQLLRIISNDPAYSSSLATRNGQKFLRSIWDHAERAVA